MPLDYLDKFSDGKMAESQDRDNELRDRAFPAEEALHLARETARSVIAEADMIIRDFAAFDPFDEEQNGPLERVEADCSAAETQLTQVYVNILNRRGALKI